MYRFVLASKVSVIGNLSEYDIRTFLVAEKLLRPNLSPSITRTCLGEVVVTVFIANLLHEYIRSSAHNSSLFFKRPFDELVRFELTFCIVEFVRSLASRCFQCATFRRGLQGLCLIVQRFLGSFSLLIEQSFPVVDHEVGYAFLGGQGIENLFIDGAFDD